MEYLGKKNRKVDSKRRITWPLKWIDSPIEKFLFVQDTYAKIYPYEKWEEIMFSLKSDKKKLEWAKKSTLMEFDMTNRLLLPSSCTWKKVDLVGVIEYVIVCESTV